MTVLALDVTIVTQPAPSWLCDTFIQKILAPQAHKWEEVSIACIDQATMAAYNSQYRNCAGATDLLSFAFPAEEGLFGGQMFLYFGAIESYAQTAKLPLDLRWAHLIAHGLAHLQGLDHQTQEQAASMWAAEQEIWEQIIELLPHLKDWTFTKDYHYFYKNILVHKSYPPMG